MYLKLNTYRPSTSQLANASNALKAVKIKIFEIQSETFIVQDHIHRTANLSLKRWAMVAQHDISTGKGKGDVNLYSASSRTPLTHSDMDHTMLPANNTLPLPVSITQAASPRIANAWVQLTTHLSTPRGWMVELAMLTDIQRTVYPEKVTRQLQVMAQDRESSPVVASKLV